MHDKTINFMATNGKSAALNLNNEQKQLVLSGILGDGCITISKHANKSAIISFNSSKLEYIQFKQKIFEGHSSDIRTSMNRGYKLNEIHSFSTRTINEIYEIGKYSIEEILNNLDDFGLALWVYDDGSLHKRGNFYNLNTHAFDEETQVKYFIPFFNKKGIYPTIAYDRKKDGRVFTYLRINKLSGADKISKILEKYRINCYNYKIWSSETIQKWSKAQESLKSENMEKSI